MVHRSVISVILCPLCVLSLEFLCFFYKNFINLNSPLPGVSNRFGSASRLLRYCGQLQAKPVAVRCPANACPCKHGSPLPGVSHKKSAAWQPLGCLTTPRFHIFQICSFKKSRTIPRIRSLSNPRLPWLPSCIL